MVRKPTIYPMSILIMIAFVVGCVSCVVTRKQSTTILIYRSKTKHPRSGNTGYRGEAPVVTNTIKFFQTNVSTTYSIKSMKNKEQIPPKKERISKVRTTLTYYPINNGEVITGVSQVVEDESFTIEEILEKFARGINLGLAFNNAEYSDTEDFDDVDERDVIKDYSEIGEASERIAARQAKRKAKSSGKEGTVQKPADEPDPTPTEDKP